ncbi:putative baseplate assembly protein [Candidatus Accumulibacter cognatus]|uniref:Baseplate wedge subunit n=1 Tax=Candidatus Accumulibacter cognatus TaxID=2954383 RepID=A0A080M3Z7_9PROT|nr:putative baseplate assembly protein [Candidatus Accumulibacter cognatus]KFB75923.1 MAG: baseplate wedge subunit [Candidatus Accumulibacter cognatus]
MTRLGNEERLEDRARDLDGKGLNAFRLAYVTLDAAPKPAFAWLDVEFWNANALAPLPPREAFKIQGATRQRSGNPARAVAVLQVLPGAGNTLRLQIAPVGDYSTYLLSTTSVGLGAPDNALPLAMDPLLNALPFKFRPGCFNLNCTPMEKGRPAPTEPEIDYLARDYDSFRHVLIAAMMRRVPGWSPSSEADLDQVLIDLVAADADEQADYHDRVMNERALATARKRVSLARHARLLDYHIHQGNQASTWLALEVAGMVDLPATGQDEFGVWSGRAWQDDDAVIFAMARDGGSWRQRCFAPLNRLRLYTWGKTVTALATGSTEADLTAATPLTQTEAEALRDFFLGTHASQVPGPGAADVNTAVDQLLIQEALNPETGTANGRRIAQRQLLKLLPLHGPIARAEALQDPFTGEWLVRVRWRAEDALRQNFCFVCDCAGQPVEDVSLFHANLLRVTQGRPRITTFRAPGQPLGGADERSFVASDSVSYEIVLRQAGSASPPRGVLCPLPASPLAYRASAPGGETPTRTTAQVMVQGFAEPWQEQSDLIESQRDDQHFIVETDELGGSSLRFGDGSNGAALPMGAFVQCRYRVGQGSQGNVGADSLVGFVDASGAVQRVWNPFDVTNGRDPEPAAEIVRRVPEAYRQHQLRAVTLDDYARRAEELPGVAHARARYAWTGSWRCVQVAIDPAGGIVLAEPLRRALADHLDAVRLIGEDLEVGAARYVPLDIKLSLCAQPAYWPEDLRAALEEEFSDGWMRDGRHGFFHPDRWTFGQPLYASQLIGRALSVTGVGRVLRASMRRWNPGSGGGLTEIDIDPLALPESRLEKIPVGPFEIIVVANDPDHLETGRIRFEITGGRR